MISYILALSIVSSVAYAQQGVYVPGSPPDVAGVSASLVSVGADGLSTYDVGGVTLAENSATAILTQSAAGGPLVYSCVLGVDAMATCSVTPQYAAPAYGYTEPITFFGQSTAQLPAVYGTQSVADTSAAVAVAATSSAASGMATVVTSSTSAAVSSPTAAPAAASSKSAVGPAANAAQSTASNVFGASASATGAGSRSASSSVVLSAVAALSAAMAGAALFL